MKLGPGFAVNKQGDRSRRVCALRYAAWDVTDVRSFSKHTSDGARDRCQCFLKINWGNTDLLQRPSIVSVLAAWCPHDVSTAWDPLEDGGRDVHEWKTMCASLRQVL